MKIIITLFFLFSLFKADEVLPLHLLPHKHVQKGKNPQSTPHHGGGPSKMYQLVGFDDSFKILDVKYITSTLKEKTIEMNGNMIVPPRSGVDNYHVLVANSSKENSFFTAVYYKYEHGKPSRTSPTKLTSKSKATFEIIPDPLPREHDRYYGSKNYTFLLKFEGKALTSHQVKLTTENETTLNYITDEEGRFEITLPNDFKDVKVSKRGNAKPHFILSSQIQKGDQEYFTTFANPYNVNPHDYWSSTTQGLIVVVIGLIIGLLILWRRKNG